MKRQLRPDTFDKQVNHHFREITKMTPKEVTIRSFEGSYLNDGVEGFNLKPTVFRAIAINNHKPEDTRITLINYWRLGDQSLETAKKTAAYMANIRDKTLDERQAAKEWPTLGQLAELYSRMAAKSEQRLMMMLPFYSPDKFEMRYPRVKMTYVHYAATDISENSFSAEHEIAREIENDAAITRRLRKNVLDRTTITKNALLILNEDEHHEIHLRKLLNHEIVKLGPYTLKNSKEDIAIEDVTWTEGGLWLEYLDGTLSIRHQHVPAILLQTMIGKTLDEVVDGVPNIAKATIIKTSNPKKYVMQARPRNNGRNDAPALRMKLDNKRMTLRKAGINWTGPSPIHQAIAEASKYMATVPGPFATTSAQENLAKLIEIAKNYRLM